MEEKEKLEVRVGDSEYIIFFTKFNRFIISQGLRPKYVCVEDDDHLIVGRVKGQSLIIFLFLGKFDQISGI